MQCSQTFNVMPKQVSNRMTQKNQKEKPSHDKAEELEKRIDEKCQICT